MTMFGHCYRHEAKPPTQYPCCTCTEHGHYCADHCARLDAWREQHEARRAETGTGRDDDGNRK